MLEVIILGYAVVLILQLRFFRQISRVKHSDKIFIVVNFGGLCAMIYALFLILVASKTSGPIDIPDLFNLLN